MKMLRYGDAGVERRGLIDAKDPIRDLRGGISNTDGKALSKDGLTKGPILRRRNLRAPAS